MITISLCMIVKNEESSLEMCLNSAKSIVDEIIIVDTGSTDLTKEVASRFTNKIFDFEWIDDFSAARNFSFEKATMDYILWLDADDVILPEDATTFNNLKEFLPPNVDVVMMKYNIGFNQQGKVTFSYFRERLTKKSQRFKWKDPVHEYLETRGKIVNSNICITHTKQHKNKGKRNIQIYEKLIAKTNELTPRSMYYYARELKDNGRYNEAIRWFGLFLDSERGWIEDKITACGELAKCYQIENKPNEALSAMLCSFNFDAPRAEICCQIGYYFKSLGNYKLAVFWFELILKLERDIDNWGFQQEECWGYIPCIECAVCYDYLGDCVKSTYYNERASEYMPDSPAIIYNRQYFKSKSEKNNIPAAQDHVHM